MSGMSVDLELISDVFSNAGEEDPGPPKGRRWTNINCSVPTTLNHSNTHAQNGTLPLPVKWTLWEMNMTQYLIYGEIHLMNLIPVLEYKKRNSGISSAVGPLGYPASWKPHLSRGRKRIPPRPTAIRMVFL